MRVATISLIIPAAGTGRRMGAAKNKLLLPLNGEPVLCHTLRAFKGCGELAEVILAVREDEMETIRNLAASVALHCPVKVVVGGPTRQESVANGARAASEQCREIWVHDGARPFVDSAMLHRLVHRTEEHVNAVVAVAVKDTVKRADADGCVLDTPQRQGLWLIQTPQVFSRNDFLTALSSAERDGYQGTDDASLLERINSPVQIIEGNYFNIKITTPEDIILAEAILGYYQGRCE